MSEKVNPFFRIKKEAIRTDSGTRIPHRFALLNAKTNGLLGIMSHEYEVILNSNVSKLFDEALKDYPYLKYTDHLDALQRKWKRQIVLKGKDVTFDVAKNDKVAMVIEIFNGYDVRSSFGYEILAYSFNSNSYLILGKRGVFKESYYHFTDNPKRLLDSIEVKFDDFKQHINQWKRWAKEELPDDVFESFIVSRRYLSQKIQEEVVILTNDIFRGLKLKGTKWDYLNVLMYLAEHETKARKGSHIFSNRFKLFERMIEDYYHIERMLRAEHGVIE
jgi:hypothetical protein